MVKISLAVVFDHPYLAALVAVLLLLTWIYFKFGAIHVSGVRPVSTFYPFFGHIFHLLPQRDDPLNHALSDMHSFGEVDFFVSLPTFVPFIVSTDPSTAKHVLETNFDNYEKGWTFRYLFQDLLGEGIFNSDGPHWKKQRKAASFMFSMRILKHNMTNVFLDHGHKLINYLDGVSKSSPNGGVTDMQKHFFDYTFDSICEIGFGVKDRDEPFAQAFDLTQQLIEKRFTDPLFPLKRFLNIGTEQEIRKRVQIMDAFSYRIIKERREQKDLAARQDLLSIFMHEMQKDGSSYDDKFLRDMVINFMIAGRDTTAVFLSWTFYMFSQHPKHEARVIKELNDHIGEGNDPSYENVAGLTYLHAFMNETLRLYPPVPRDSKSSIKPDVLPNGTHVPAGVSVAYSPYLYGRCKKIWGPDAGEFRPSRWLEETAEGKTVVKKVGFDVFPVFNGGPRECLGKHVAYLEAKLLVAMLLPRFKFDVDPNHSHVRYEPSITMPIRGGLHMVVTRR